jgi:benzil reductase ((S)-benzoin forming)
VTGERVSGRVAVVTGASRGLGAGLAARLAARGLGLGLCARHEPPRPPGSGEPGPPVVTAAVDVTDADAVDRFCARVVERLGRIDLWVNNAGVLDPIGPLRAVDAGALRTNIEVNVLGVLYGSAAFARHVRARPGGGTLVNISSGAGARPYQGWAGYCAAKAAVDHATRVVAAEEADAGLRAFAVSPGVVDTAMQAAIRATPAERFPAVGRFHALKREGAFNSPAWVADRILDLAAGEPGEPGGAGDAGDVVRRLPDEPRAG